ncbi:SWIM zinc finger family protein [Haladaptatus halobius]|uniref:SWIM zinc finger family protein n=1 Tax=Haladaptatus halobius TaxID=2884875 RepID=UPI001D09FE97|nr:SWIM zinc finger family protein [Haladaptatus halobius]
MVSINDMAGELMACMCPHHILRNAFYKHMTAVETLTDDSTLTAFSSDDETYEETETAECGCDGLDGFPCWPCVCRSEGTASLIPALFSHFRYAK